MELGPQAPGQPPALPQGPRDFGGCSGISAESAWPGHGWFDWGAPHWPLASPALLRGLSWSWPGARKQRPCRRRGPQAPAAQKSHYSGHPGPQTPASVSAGTACHSQLGCPLHPAHGRTRDGRAWVGWTGGTPPQKYCPHCGQSSASDCSSGPRRSGRTRRPGCRLAWRWAGRSVGGRRW